MELFSAEANAIKAQVSEWIQHADYELETVFGERGVVDSTTFIAVAKRLRAKGYTNMPQEDRLTITTKDHVRFSLDGLGIIQKYCSDDVLAGKPFTAMIKDRAVATKNVDVEEYDIRIKQRREVGMAQDDAEVKKLLDQWSRIPKAFRMIRRWTFEGEGIRIDMSIVRSTKTNERGEYKWQRKFRDQDIMESVPSYEIEVELIRTEGDTPESAMKRLVKHVGEVLRGVQKNTLLIRKSQVRKVLDSYSSMVGSKKFRGPAPVTLQVKNMRSDREPKIPNIRDGYNVTDKADGLRCLGFCDSKGELFLIDMSMRNVYKTGLEQPECRESLIDGEWVTLTIDKEPTQQFLAFDIFLAADKKDVSQFPFQEPAPEEALSSRYGQLKKWILTWNKGDGPTKLSKSITPLTKLQISLKDFYFGRADATSIFRQAERCLDTAKPYYRDGLIFTPNKLPLPAEAGSTFYEQFKWKPSKDNTIDFLVKMERVTDTTRDKITVGIQPDTGETVSYKTLRLFVGSRKDDARDVILNMRDLPGRDRRSKGKDNYKPVPFTPREFPDLMASICNLPIHEDPDTGETYVKTHDSDEPIQDNTIVEMAYNPKAAPGWRWIPLRVRMDKTERFQLGVIGRTLNSDMVANDNWNSIYDPITEFMIRKGSDQPSEEEQAELNRLTDEQTAVAKKYYDRKAPVENKMLTRGMRDFHNKWIKERILYSTALQGRGKTLIDTACGVAADLQIWRRRDVSFVLGVDYAGENIRGENDSAYGRYMDTIINNGGRDSGVPPMIFAVGNSAKNYVNGDAGMTEEDKNILRSVLGRKPPTGPIPTFVDKEGASRLKLGADCMSCMFALHYFFETPETLRGFVKNIGDNLKVGGYFIGACFDGEKVFDLLRGVPKGGARVGLEGDATLWKIIKDYEEDEFPEGDDSLGLPISVDFVTTGDIGREFLVNIKTLENALKQVGCELLSGDELKKAKLVQSTSTFDVSFEMAKKAGEKYKMPDAIKQFSFLNRWFIFQRKRQASPLETDASGLVSLKRNAVNSVAGLPEAEAEAEIDATGSVIPVAKPKEALPAVPTYASGELFQFFDSAAEKDVLKIGDKTAGQWLSPSAPFPIEDPEVEGVKYPSLEHYLAAQKWRLASTTPDVATAVFSNDGSIHQEFLRQRLLESEGGKKPITEKRNREILKAESVAVRNAISPAAFKKYKSTFDPAQWSTQKDDVLMEGLRQRWETDARFRKIVEAVRQKGMTLLYYAPGSSSSDLGGVRKNNGSIEGDNKMGKMMMELAGF
uniref:mRNA (guanine-N(7))-methyltransferase n=1 Tax=viral metagenome TaxID=1070528 RepID=A0A6C0JXM8_9ZZZZ